MNWREFSTDPNDKIAKQAIHKHLLSIREVKKFNYTSWLIEKVKDKSCLDVGAVEHDLSYTEKETWKHKQLAKSAAHIVGIDVLKEYAEALQERGYDIRHCDATSEEYIGEKFDTVVLGDVIEHVNNPVDLIRFAKRHLNPGGEIIAKTPNPYYFDAIKKCAKNRDFVSLDHLAWYTPTMALEIAERAGCNLKAYILENSEHPWYLKFMNPEIFSRDYIYIFE